MPRTRINIRQIPMDSIERFCTYPLPKGVKLKDFIIHKDQRIKRYCIIGIGDSGIDGVETIMQNSSHYLPLMADIDHNNLDKINTEHKLYLMGDVEDEEMLTIENRRTLSDFVKTHQSVHIITRLDNDLNQSHVVEKIVQHLNRIKRDVLLIVIKPFLFELPPYRIELSTQILKDNERYVKQLIIIDSEDMLAMKNKSTLSLKECFTFLDNVVKEVIEKKNRFGNEKVVTINLKEGV